MFIFVTTIAYGVKNTTFQSPIPPWIQWSMSNTLYIVKSPLSLFDGGGGGIFSTVFAFDAQMITRVSDYQYDIGVKGKCQIYI